jgi:acetyl esterase/lipase
VRPARYALLTLAVALAALLSACRKQADDVVVYKNISYYDGPGRDARKHLLDLYLPAGEKDFPVVVFVHGGGWRHGYKDGFLNAYYKVGEGLARRGIGVVVTTYRLAPEFKHPAAAEDVARAVAWTYRNTGDYGGDPDRVFLCGHSAGAHLVSLVALDRRFLAAEGLPPEAVRGVVGLSGPYDAAYLAEDDGIPSLFARFYYVRPTFGDDPAAWPAASAPTYARADAPPFLLLYGEYEVPHMGRQAYRLSGALGAWGVDAPAVKVAGKHHGSIIFDIGKEGDATTAWIEAFVKGSSEGQ